MPHCESTQDRLKPQDQVYPQQQQTQPKSFVPYNQGQGFVPKQQFLGGYQTQHPPPGFVPQQQQTSSASESELRQMLQRLLQGQATGSMEIVKKLAEMNNKIDCSYNDLNIKVEALTSKVRYMEGQTGSTSAPKITGLPGKSIQNPKEYATANAITIRYDRELPTRHALNSITEGSVVQKGEDSCQDDVMADQTLEEPILDKQSTRPQASPVAPAVEKPAAAKTKDSVFVPTSQEIGRSCLMPLSVAKRLGFSEYKSCNNSLILADGSVRLPHGLLEDLPIKIENVKVPTDFIVLEMDEEPKNPLILGRPFLATAGAVINLGKDFKMKFDINDAIKKPSRHDQHSITADSEVQEGETSRRIEVSVVQLNHSARSQHQIQSTVEDRVAMIKRMVKRFKPTPLPPLAFPGKFRKAWKEKYESLVEKQLDGIEAVMPLTEVLKLIPDPHKDVRNLILERIKRYHDSDDGYNATPFQAVGEKIVQEKLEDPGSFTLPCSIRHLAFSNCLCDLGASVSLMPLSVARKLGFVQYRPCDLTLTLADRSSRRPFGLLEDLPVMINEVEVPTDFVFDINNTPRRSTIEGKTFEIQRAVPGEAFKTTRAKEPTLAQTKLSSTITQLSPLSAPDWLELKKNSDFQERTIQKLAYTVKELRDTLSGFQREVKPQPNFHIASRGKPTPEWSEEKDYLPEEEAAYFEERGIEHSAAKYDDKLGEEEDFLKHPTNGEIEYNGQYGANLIVLELKIEEGSSVKTSLELTSLSKITNIATSSPPPLLYSTTNLHHARFPSLYSTAKVHLPLLNQAESLSTPFTRSPRQHNHPPSTPFTRSPKLYHVSYASSQDHDYNVNEDESWSTYLPEREGQEYSLLRGDITRGKKTMREISSSLRNVATKPWKTEKKKISMEEYCELYRRHNFVGTRYPHPETMVELGIFDDIEYLCEQTSLFTLMNRPYSAYKEETIQFLSSFQVEIFSEKSKKRERDYGLGYLTFTIHGQEYIFTIKQLESLFGFRSGVGTGHHVDRKELTGLWETIGDDVKFFSARSKSNTIRSPILRYFHRSLASVLFAREITGTIVNAEMEVMVMTLQETLGLTKDNTVLVGDKSNSSAVFFLLGHLWSYKSWTVTNAKKTAKGKLCMGGLITPILLACGVPLESEEVFPKWVDIEYLRKSTSLDWEMLDGRCSMA
ncbi:hypothetical protein ISN44_As10g010270 [Arabidopsis suecica]|uniref:Arabidopsis retrotransposon Orf1 C-terminal domain-containing protein n=1 Tax=Arabidopsis suecica TaxID=45249 RepID=A0A8T1ZXE9_ARASU|nr:hypothetical protein ISN44_As10g010270 [Arabidopsis suecica]